MKVRDPDEEIRSTCRARGVIGRRDRGRPPNDAGNGSCTLAQLSPESRAKAERNTRPFTSGIPGAA